MARRFRFFLLFIGILGGLGYAALRAVRPGGVREVRASLSVAELLRADSVGGFARALEPRSFRFPLDHGPHPDFRTEWWYVTGNLEGPEGDPFGFQLTFFRNSLEPGAPARESSWATNQVFMGHFAMTDGGEKRFRAYERFSRGALGLAGAQAEPFRVWLEDWVLEGPIPVEDREPPDRTPAAEPGVSGSDLIFPLRLEAMEEGYGVSLILRPAKPLVLQGDWGLSQKGPETGNASFYYSFTRLEAEGTFTLAGEEVRVQGKAWLDREWSTSALSRDQVGWDWFALQLSDGRDLMYYQLRRADGTPHPLSKGVLVEANGESRMLSSEMVELSVLDRWQSPLGGDPYPSRWHLAIPTEGIQLEVLPILSDQELDLTFRYWEGAVKVSGTRLAEPLGGRGYVELTGYADSAEVDQESRVGRGISSP